MTKQVQPYSRMGEQSYSCLNYDTAILVDEGTGYIDATTVLNGEDS